MKWHFNRSTTIVSWNDNAQSHEQEESKLNSTSITNSSIHILIGGKVIKSPLSKNNVVTIKNKQNSNKDVITRANQIVTLLMI